MSTVERIVKTLQLLRSRDMTISELSRELEVHRSSAMRLLNTLTEHGLTRQTPVMEFTLGPTLIDLGHQALEKIDVREIARPYIKLLRKQTNETIHLGILGDNNNVIYIDKVDSQHPVRMYSQIGKSAPLHCTGVGKALLCGMHESTRDTILNNYQFTQHTEKTLTSKEALLKNLRSYPELGYVTDNGEHETTVNCIAAPIHSPGGNILAAISISVPSQRKTLHQLEQYRTGLLDAVMELSRQLGSI